MFVLSIKAAEIGWTRLRNLIQMNSFSCACGNFARVKLPARFKTGFL